MNTVHCIDNNGRSVSVPAESVLFRPAVYGILVEDGTVLLAQNEVTGLWQPPGRMLAAHETPYGALIHHIRRATGDIPVVGPLLMVEQQYRVDTQKQAWRLSVLYYALERQATRSVVRSSPESSNQLGVVAINELRRSQMQFGFEAVQAGRLRLELVHG